VTTRSPKKARIVWAPLRARDIARIARPPLYTTDGKLRGAKERPDGLVAGLYLSVTPAGVKSWVLRYRHHGRPRKFTIGRWPNIDVTPARKLAKELFVRIAAGEDPQYEKVEARRRDVPDSFEALAIAFIEKKCHPDNRSWLDYARALGLKLADADRRRVAHLKPPFKWNRTPGSPAAIWRNRPVGTIEKREVASYIQGIVDRGHGVAANRALAILSSTFTWMVGQGYLTASPSNGIPKPTKEEASDRVLAGWELALIWQASGKLEPVFQAFVRLLILLGQRRSETAGIQDRELRLGLHWTLPKERSKNKRENEIVLPETAADLLEALPRHKGCPYLLTTDRKHPVSGFGRIKKLLDIEIAKLPGGDKIEDWSFHDLRRTFASGAARLGVQPHVVEACLNHKTGVISGVAGVYNRHDYGPEKKAAWRLWEAHVLKIGGAEAT